MTETRFTHATAALLIGLAMIATVGGALLFQHLGGYIPCKLCYEQRTPYYLGVPVMLAAFLSASFKGPSWLTRALLAFGGLLMLWAAYLGAYHAGVEWGWWAGPTDCGAAAPSVNTGGAGVLDSLDSFVPPACDHAALRIAGISLAGWNFLIALVLAVVAFGAVARKR